MKIFAATDLHGEVVDVPDCDLVLIAGDFAKGEKLREAVFNKGDLEEAKREIIESSVDFLKRLPKKSIISSGNAEKPCLNEISKEAEKLGHYFLNNRKIEMGGLKIIGLNFFMEKEWAKKAYPEDKSKIERAKKEESEIRAFLEENPDADIILSHLPPFGILDSNPNPPKFLPENYPKNCGSKLLLKYIKKNQPKLVICGHIHISGEVELGKTKVINPGKGKLLNF